MELLDFCDECPTKIKARPAYQKQRPIARIICNAGHELSRPLCSLESLDISAEFASLERVERSRRGGGVSAK
jgi:hypothetical protein